MSAMFKVTIYCQENGKDEEASFREFCMVLTNLILGWTPYTISLDPYTEEEVKDKTCKTV